MIGFTIVGQKLRSSPLQPELPIQTNDMKPTIDLNHCSLVPPPPCVQSPPLSIPGGWGGTVTLPTTKNRVLHLPPC